MGLRGLHLKDGLRHAMPFGLCLLLAGSLSVQGQQTDHAPAGWFLAGDNPANYRTGVDSANMHDGLPSAYLAALDKGKGFGTLMQSINAAEYAGKRVRLRGWVKSQDVGDWAGLWFRVDKGRQTVAFDNMQDRGIKGTQSWNSYDVVLDVPNGASTLNFGILLSGTGEVWLNNLSIEVVDASTSTTGMAMRTPLPNRPVNLGFNQ